MSTPQRLLLLLALLFFGLANTLTAQTTWTGSVSTEWNTAGNWSAGIPDATDDVIIPDVTNDPVISIAGAVAKSVSIQSGGFLTLAAASTLSISGATVEGLANQGTVVNNGTITIADMEAGSSHGIHNVTTFTNAAGATINIDGITATGSALRNSDPGVFTNAGTITIGANRTAGNLGIENHRTFKNNAGGLINIDRAASSAIYNTLTFDNTGTIRIGANAGTGSIGINNKETFNNNSGGEINIDNVTSTGIVNSGSPWGVDNLGTINIGALPGGNTFPTGVYNTGNFRIIGGRLTINRVSDGMNLQSTSTTENYASVTIGEIASVSYLLKGLGKFKNNTGAVLKGTGRISSTAIENAGGTLAPGYSPGKMSFVGPHTVFTNCTFAIEVNGTGIAGTDYDQFVMEDGMGSIGARLSLTINYTPAKGDRFTIVRGTAIEGELRPTTFLPHGWILENGDNKIDLVYDGIPSSSEWTGAVNNDWNTDGNWSAGVPGAITSVTIPNATNDPVISTATAAARSVNVYSGGLLTVSNTGVLTINSATSIGLYNQDTIQNNGTINIGNLSAVGYNGLRNEGIFNNNTGGIINIDRATETALYNGSGTFSNAGTINIGKFSAAGSNGIRNESTFNNNTGGIITIDRATGTALYNAFGTFSNLGSIAIGANEATGTDGLDNDATFNNNAGAQITIDRVTSAGIYNNGADFTNAGTISMGSLNGGNTINWGIYSDKPFNNTGGQINIDRVNAALATNMNTFNNAGTVTIGAISGVATLLSGTGTGTFSNNTGGIIKGTGSIDAARFVNAGGSVAPGYSPGIMTFAGDETFSNSTMNIELNGTAVPGTDYDQVVVNGAVTVGGNLIVSTINGFTMAAGQTFNFIAGTSVSGTFASVTWPAGVNGTVTYSSNGVSLNVISVLPLTLIEFTGHATGNKTELQWKTANEENTSVFEVERSTNGVNFTTIGTIAAMGSGANSYAATDKNPATGNNYYRLRMVDKDGQFTYSKTALVKFAAKRGLKVVPVPANSYITLTVKDQSLVGQHAQVYNTAGILVADVVLTAATRIDIAGWPAGIYNIKTSAGAYRFIKQ